MMTGLLEIEQQILDAMGTTSHARFLRRIVAHQYADASIRHSAFNAHLDALIEKGYVEPVPGEPGNYRVTESGEAVLEHTKRTLPA